jgi:hypothetical protein
MNKRKWVRVCGVLLVVWLVVAVAWETTDLEWVARWAAWRGGLIQSVQVAQAVDPEDPKWQPVIHDHSLFDVEVERLTACQCLLGGNQEVVFFVESRAGDGLQGVQIQPQLVLGEGAVADVPQWIGFTNDQGTLVFRHLCVPTRYDVWVEGELAISGLRMDLPWYEYCNPSDPYSPAPPHGWRVVNKPGFYGYHVYLILKE